VINGVEEIGRRSIFDDGGNVGRLVQDHIVPNDDPLIIWISFNRIVLGVGNNTTHKIAESELITGLLCDEDPSSWTEDVTVDSGRQPIAAPFYSKDHIYLFLVSSVVWGMANMACSVTMPIFCRDGAEIEARLINIY